MIYIENNLEKQDLFIPRNDGSGCYVSPYDKGYQDGIDDCGDCPIQQKEVVLTATTETISPDQGYAGMDSVFVDARQLALEKYNEGYHEGEEDGAEGQKSKLTSTAFTQNGVYRREDGWNEVEVVVEQTGTTCNLESKTETVTADTQTILPSSGYDGMSEVVVDATNYGQDKYDEGFADGQASVPPCPPCPPCPEPNIESGVTFPLNSGFTQTTVTPSSGYDGIGDITIYDNGYGQERYDNGFTQGYAQGQADCPSCPEIESAVTYGIGSGFTGATVTPSSGYDGMAEVTITDNGYGQEKYDEGFTDGQTDILSGMTDTTIRQNGSYSNPSGWSGVTVSVQPTLEAASYALPTGFTGTTIVPSSGYDGLSSVVITDNGYGQEKYDEGYSDGQASCPQPTLEQQSVTLTATTECFYPSSGYDGIEEICVDATDIYNQGYEDGKNEAEGNDKYFTFEAIEDGEIGFHYEECDTSVSQTYTALTVSYSINGGAWNSITSTTAATNQIVVSAGDVVRFKSTNSGFSNYSSNGCLVNHKITNTNNCYVYGNIMSLLYGDNFDGEDEITEAYAFSSFFSGNQKIYLHPTKPLSLPATTLTNSCYAFMFKGCNITSSPKLPATTLAISCYRHMFEDCINLSVAPSLPATNLADGCYSYMFEGCTSLAVAPELPATTLFGGCYEGMFENCTSLTAAPSLMATTIPTSGFFGAYSSMFQGCSSLSYIKCNATTFDTQYGFDYWVYGVATNGVFLKNSSMSNWPTGNNGIPSGWTVRDIQ